jgi:hypothetical protein
MQTRYLSSNSGPGDSRPGNSSVFTKYVGNLCRPTIGLAFAAILISSGDPPRLRRPFSWERRSI